MRYHLHARLFEGTLDAPTRNELQSEEAESRREINAIAARLAAAGFAVWVYQHDPAATRASSGENGGYRVVDEWAPGATSSSGRPVLTGPVAARR